MEEKKTVDEWGQLHNVRLGAGVIWTRSCTFQEFTNLINDYGFEARAPMEIAIEKLVEEKVQEALADNV